MPEIERSLEVAASSRVLALLRRRAVARAPGGVVLGLEQTTLRGLAERCAAETGALRRGELRGAALRRIAEHSVRGVEAYEAWVREHPGAAGALSSSLQDLRDAGIVPEALTPGPLREVYTNSESRLDALAAEGWLDRVALFRLAASGAGRWCQRLALRDATVHGATDLVGSAGDLLDAIGEAIPLRLLQPDWGDPQVARLREQWPWRFTVEPVAPESGRMGGSLADCLPPSCRVWRALGPREELDQCCLRIVERLDGGARPEEITVVARSLAAHAPWLSSAFERHGIPIDSSLTRPALSFPQARRWLDLARALASGLERTPMLRALSGPGMDASLRREARKAAAHRFIHRGLESWLQALGPEPSGSLATHLEQLGACSQALIEGESWGARVATLCEASAGLGVDDPNDAAVRAIHDALESLGSLDAVDSVFGEVAAVSVETFLHAVETVLGEASVPLTRLHTEVRGVQVLDAVQARGLPIRHLFLIGFAHGTWPRELSPDALLGDSERHSLVRATGRPLPLRRAAPDEEHQLLGLLLAQTSDTVELSWSDRRADGRTQLTSGYLRQLGAREDPPIEPLAWQGSGGLACAGDALVGAALERGADALCELASALGLRLEPDLPAALSAQLAIESPEPGDLCRDGSTGPVPELEPLSLSPSFLDGLAGCPLQAWLSRLLRVPEPLRALERDPDASELGSEVHALLKRLYDTLANEGALDGSRCPERAAARAQVLLTEEIDSADSRFRARLQPRFPGLWRALAARLQIALGDFIERDVRRLATLGVTRLESEWPVEGSWGTGANEIRLGGRLDRIVWTREGEIRIGDYKTGRSVDTLTSRTALVRGQALQVPLYARLVGDTSPDVEVRGEILHVPLRPERVASPKSDRERLTPAPDERLDQVLETLVGLLRAGRFPIHVTDNCDYCAYAIACRRRHAPSRDRSSQAPEYQRYRDMIERKS